MKFEFRATKSITQTVEADNVKEAYEKFLSANNACSDVHIESIDDKEVLGICEDSGKPICDGDHYFCDEEGIMWIPSAAEMKERYGDG